MSKWKNKSAAFFTGISESAHSLSNRLGNSDFVREINESSRSTYQTLSEKISAAMDHAYKTDFKAGMIDPETGLKVSFSNHRILDESHDILGSLNKALEVGEAEGASKIEVFTAWAQSHLTDMSSPGGMPILPGSDKIYAFLRENLGLTEERARDLITVNGQETIEILLGSTISAIALIFAWNKEDKEQFSRSLGSIGAIAIITANPISGIITLTGLGLAYNKEILDHKSVKKSALIAGASLGISILAPGPMLVGIIPAIALSIYLEKITDKELKLSDNSKLIKSDIQKRINKLIPKIKSWNAA